MTIRECIWCREWITVRKDGRLSFHRWMVGWDRDRGRPVMDRCVGSGTSIADAKAAMAS